MIREYIRHQEAEDRRIDQQPCGFSGQVEDTIDWFNTLPLWLELDGLRIIHACWDKPEIPLAPNIVCLDYIVAQLGGKLVADRRDSEQTLSRDKFIWVDREEA